MDSGKEEIEKFLHKAVDSRKIVWTIHQEFIRILREHHLPLLSYEDFKDLFKKFKQDCNLPKRKAFDSFWADLQNLDSRASENLASLKEAASKPKKVHGVKSVRSEFWDTFKDLSDIFNNLDDISKHLISEKSYRKRQNRDNDDLDYIFDAYGISWERRNDEACQKYAEKTNHLLAIYIEIFEEYLKCIPELELKNPAVLKWLVGFMGPHIKDYLPNWEDYQTNNKRKKQFKRARNLLVRYLNGESYRQLGFTKNTWHNFIKVQGPKGIAIMLAEAYNLLHGPTLDELFEAKISSLSQEVRKVFTEDHIYLFPAVIKRLYFEEFPEHKLFLSSNKIEPLCNKLAQLLKP